MTIYTILAFIISFAINIFMLVTLAFTFFLGLFGFNIHDDFLAWRKKFNDRLNKENGKSRARHAKRKQNKKNNL